MDNQVEGVNVGIENEAHQSAWNNGLKVNHFGSITKIN